MAVLAPEPKVKNNAKKDKPNRFNQDEGEENETGLPSPLARSYDLNAPCPLHLLPFQAPQQFFAQPRAERCSVSNLLHSVWICFLLAKLGTKTHNFH